MLLLYVSVTLQVIEKIASAVYRFNQVQHLTASIFSFSASLLARTWERESVSKVGLGYVDTVPASIEGE